MGGGDTTAPPPPPPPKDWAKFSAGPLANQQFALLPSAPIGLNPKISSAPLAPLLTQHHIQGGGVDRPIHSSLDPPVKSSPSHQLGCVEYTVQYAFHHALKGPLQMGPQLMQHFGTTGVDECSGVRW